MKLIHVLLVGVIAYTNAFSSRFLGTKVAIQLPAMKTKLVMEDFGIMKGSQYGFDAIWAGNPLISEVATERVLNDQNLRFRMDRTQKEIDQLESSGSRFQLLGWKLDFETIWEALGFTATSNNEARQKVKLEAVKKTTHLHRSDRKKYLAKYGYPRLTGTDGIFYADQLSTDKIPSGGFANMHKSGVVWPVPEVVEKGTYSGSAGWGWKTGKGHADEMLD